MKENPRVTRYGAIAEDLGARIRAGQFLIGSQLPPEHDLAEQFGTSRQTVREALRVLAERGLIVRRAGSGTTVVNSDSRTSFNLSVGSLSQMLSYPEGVRRQHLSSGSYVTEAASAALLGCAPGTPWFRIRALRFAPGLELPISWVDIHVAPRFASVARSRRAERLPVIEQIEQQFGEQVENADVDLIAGRVTAEMAEPLRAEAGTPALTVVRRYYGSNPDEPIETTFSVHPEGRYTYRMRLKRGHR